MNKLALVVCVMAVAFPSLAAHAQSGQIVIGAAQVDNHAPVFVGVEKGFFTDEGLNPKVVVLGVPCFEAWSWRLGWERLYGLPLPPPGGTADIEIVLPFTPEAFNIQRLQAAGRLVKIDKRDIWLESVSRQQLIVLARLYWIGQISPWRKS